MTYKDSINSIKMRKIPVSILFLVVLVSCSPRTPKCRYVIDLPDHVKNLILDDNESVKKLHLETDIEARLYSVQDIVNYRAGYLVRGREKICYFSKEGNYLASVGQKGRGPGEYIGISSCYVCEDTVSIYSNGSKSIQHYIFKDSVFTHTKTSYVPDTLMFTLLVTSDNFSDRYITHNTYHGIGGVVPSLSIYDRDFNHIVSSANSIPLGGRYYTSPFSINQYGVCFTDFLNYTIFNFHHDRIDEGSELYFKGSMIPRRYVSVEDKYKFLSTFPEGIAIPTFVLCYKEYYVIKVSYERIPLILLLDKNSGEYIVFRTLDEGGRQLIVTSLSIIDDNQLALSVLPDENTLDNPTIYLVNIERLIDMI